MPYVFVATTDTVYLAPFTSPEIVHDVIAIAVDEHVPPPGLAVAMYVIPVASPAVCVHETFRAFFRPTATTAVTASSMPTGETVAAVEATPVPIPLVATTDIE